MMNFIQPNDYLINVVNWKDSESALTSIRREVFIDEQGVPEEDELDGLDSQCQHVLVIEQSGNEAVGCARITKSGKIGRVALLKHHRGNGIGRDLMGFCTQLVMAQKQQPYLDAQTSVIPFYEVLGYVCEGDEFLDANIPHKRMRFGLSSFIQSTNITPEPDNAQTHLSQPIHKRNHSQSQRDEIQANTLEDSLEVLVRFTSLCVGRAYFLCPTSTFKHLYSVTFLTALKQTVLDHSDTQLHFVLASYDPSLGYAKPFIELARRLPSKIHLKCLSTTYREFETLKAVNARRCLEFTVGADHTYACIKQISPVQRELEQDEINRIWESHAFEHPDFRQLNI